MSKGKQQCIEYLRSLQLVEYIRIRWEAPELHTREKGVSSPSPLRWHLAIIPLEVPHRGRVVPCCASQCRSFDVVDCCHNVASFGDMMRWLSSVLSCSLLLLESSLWILDEKSMVRMHVVVHNMFVGALSFAVEHCLGHHSSG